MTKSFHGAPRRHRSRCHETRSVVIDGSVARRGEGVSGKAEPFVIDYVDAADKWKVRLLSAA